MLDAISIYWQAGGPLMPILALISYGIWYGFLGLRSRVLWIRHHPAQCSEHDLERIKHDLLVLAAFTAAAPLLGLLGTVAGMVSTFQAVSTQVGNTSNEVAAGISQALITTQTGLLVAIPGLFGRVRIERLLNHAQSGIRTDRLFRGLKLALPAEARS